MVIMTPAVTMLEAARISFSINEYDRHLSNDGDLRDFGQEAAEALGLSAHEVFKTLVVASEYDELIVAVLPASCQLSMKLVAVAAAVKRVSMCQPLVAERSSGYVVCGISPLGQRRQLRTFIDESADMFDTIYVSGGRRGLDIGLAPADLARVLDATIAPITA